MLIYIKVLVVVLSILGVLGTFLPILPGTPLIAIGAVIFGVVTHFQTLTVFDVVTLIGLSALAEGLDYLLSVLGAKRFGASKAGLLGGSLGVFGGLLLLGPVGIFLGPFAGAILAEVLTGRRLSEAVRVGVGSLIGVLGGMVMTFIISVIMAIWVLIEIF